MLGQKRAGGRYVLGELLGRGGMAEVFAGHAIGDHGFQKPVAIKRLLPELASDRVFVERLIAEAKLLVGIQHGNIVSVLDLARDGDDVFLVMEYVDGPSLRQLLKALGSHALSLGVATYIVQAAAAGLAFAHGRPGGAIIHADISPSNLLLTSSGEVRVADFGIARREGGGHGIVEGKWAYMAPEQARGEGLTPRCDVFALGVVLYELICGIHPLGHRVTPAQRDSVPLRVIPPRVVDPSIPAGLDAICMRALAPEPRDRYARMQQLIDALVEERFANQYREAASELAQTIRMVAPQAAVGQLRTQVTDRPVTIATRSLLRDATPVATRATELASLGRSASGTPAPTFRDDAELARGAALLELPPLLRADGTPMPPFRVAPPIVGAPELASVVGGTTLARAPVIALEPRGNAWWAFAVLGLAAVVGAIAAVLIQLAPASSPVPAAPPPRVATPAPPIVVPIAVPAPVVEPAPARRISDELRDVITPVEPAVAAPAAATRAAHPPAKPRAPARAARKPRPPGYLRVGGGEWCWVHVGGKKYDSSTRITLPPGRYGVRLVHPTTGKAKTASVTIAPEGTAVLRPRWEDDA